MREEWRERQEDRREKEHSRDGMGVGTFSLVRLVFKEDGVFISDYEEKTTTIINCFTVTNLHYYCARKTAGIKQSEFKLKKPQTESLPQ